MPNAAPPAVTWPARIARVFRRAVSRSSFASDGAWTLFAKVVTQAAQLASFIVAARVLSSSEFGFFAYSSVFALLFVAIAEGGWGEFVMKMGEDRSRLSQIATVALVSGSVVALLGLGASAIIAFAFGQRGEALLIGLFACWILPSSLSTVYDGIMVTRGRLRDLALVRILAEIVGLGVVVSGIWGGWSFLALAAGRLAAQLTSLAATALLLRWLPRLRLRRAFVLELLDFSRHIVSNRFIVYLRSYSATLVVGSFLGLADAGYYRAAERIVAAFSELVGEPARVLAWTTLRRAAGRSADVAAPSADIGRAATTFMTVLMTISLPVYVGLALISDNLVHFVLGPSWAPVGILVTLLALKQILLIPGYVTEPLLSLSGTIRKMPPTVLVNSLVGIGLLLALAPFGMLAAAGGQCAAAVFSFFISVRLQGRHGGMQWGRVLRDSAYVLVALVAMAVIVLLTGDIAAVLSISRIPTVVGQVIIGAVSYLGALLLVEKIIGAPLPIFRFAHR